MASAFGASLGKGQQVILDTNPSVNDSILKTFHFEQSSRSRAFDIFKGKIVSKKNQILRTDPKRIVRRENSYFRHLKRLSVKKTQTHAIGAGDLKTYIHISSFFFYRAARCLLLKEFC